MQLKDFFKTAAMICMAFALVGLTRSVTAAEKPNIIMVLTDDQGWMDSGVYGSKYYQTPNMDRLAGMGMRFTNAYSASPLCSPTRLSVLTGKYPHRLGMTAPVGHLPTLPANRPLYKGQGAYWQAYLVPDSKRELPNNVLTYGKMFKGKGYATAFMGKWHLGKPPYMPENHGFDTVVGGRGNPGPPGGFFAPWRSDTLPKVEPGTHIDDAITDEAIGFITENKDKPFLLNMWFYSVHAPFEGKESLVEKYRGITDSRGKQKSAVMGAMIETLDENLGRLLDQLETLGIADNTIIIYWSDNGGNMYNEVEGTTPTNNAPLSMGKGNIHEGGIRVPAMVVWPGKVKPGQVSDAIVSTIDIFPTMLDMAGMNEPKHKPFDGISLKPVLTGGDLDRNTAYFHFPHYVPKPSSMSASAVRQGDFKLIRVYDRDGDKPYKYELYNLKQDIGESNNLSAAMPDKVKAMDAMITQHLIDTKTPAPPANPAYIAGSFNPITGEGDRSLKPEPKQTNKPASNPPKGWQPGGKTKMKIAAGNLVITSVNQDPWVMCRDLPNVTGEFVGRVRMKLQTKGTGEMFWASKTNPGFAGHNVAFPLKHDGEWHTYEVKMPAKGPLTNFRLDPGQAPGEILVDWIEIVGTKGKVIKRWTFGK
ncbi:MAG: sulfatase [Phycisphaeraceae bacterium]